MRTVIYILLIVLVLPAAHSQQLASWSQFRTFNYTYNPASVEFGEDANFLAADIAYRQQWSAIDDAPRTALAGIQYASTDLNMAVGGFLLHDQFGPVSYSQLQAQYAYQLRFDRSGEHTLSIGLGVSAMQFRLDGEQIKVKNENDDLLTDALQSKLTVEASLGAFYYNQLSSSSINRKFLFAGLSVEQAIPSDLHFEGSGGSLANLKRELHYHGMVGTRFYYGSGYDYIEPVVWAKVAFYAPVNVMGAVRMTFNEDRFWAGVAVSSAWEGYFQFGVKIMENWQLGYANALFLANTFSSSAGMSHEFSLSYRKWL